MHLLSRFIRFNLFNSLPVLLLCLLSSLPVLAGPLDDYYLAQYTVQKTGNESVKSVALEAAVEITAQSGTPLKHGLQRDWKLLEAGTQKILAKQLASPVLASEATFTSAAGHFKVHYATTGTDAPPQADANSNGVPDWVETVAVTFENVYANYSSMGYKPAPTNPAGAPYDLYLHDLAPQGLYGLTTSDQSVSSTGYPNAFTSWLELDNNFTDSIYKPSTYTPLQSLQITAAHEYHHAVQYGYNFYFDIWFAEATSVWMEDELYDGINQNYSYIPAWFTQSKFSLDIPASVATGGAYGRWIFNRYLAEKHGTGMIRSAFEKLASVNPVNGQDIPMTTIIDDVLTTSFATTLDIDFLGFTKRVYTRDWNSHTADISRIPSYTPLSTYTSYPINASSSPAPLVTLPHYSFAYYKFKPSALAPSDLPINVNGTSGIAAAVFRKVGGVITEIPPDATGKNFSVTGFNGLNPATDEVVLLLANTTNGDNQSASFSTTASSPSNSTKLMLILSVGGTTSKIGGIDLTVTLPVGVTVKADSVTGEISSSNITLGGQWVLGRDNIVGKYTPATAITPAAVRILAVNSIGINAGEFARLICDVLDGITPIASSFSLSINQVLDANGANIFGVTTNIALMTDFTPPTLTLSTLANNVTTNNAILNVTGKVSDSGSGVKSLTINGQTTTINPDGTFSIAVTLVDGVNTIATITTDNSNNTFAVSRTITLDRTAPSLTVTTPADNSVTGKTFVEISGSVDDLNSTVTAKINGGSATTAVMSGTNFSTTLNLASGLNTIDITATDQVGNSTSVKRSITSDTTAPTLAVNNPGQDISTTESIFTLSGTVTDAITSTTISITADGQSYTPTVANDGSFSQIISLTTDKTYAVVVTATDQAGNKATVQRNIIKTTASSVATGDITGDGKVDIADALKALRIAVGLDVATPALLLLADVAPLSAGKPAPDGVIDIADALVILEKAVGLLSW